MKILADPKTLFKRDPWIVRTYYQVCSWFKYTFNKEHIRLVKEAFSGRPWDNGYLSNLEYVKIREMAEYHKKRQRFVGCEYAIRNMEICLSLIEIFTEKRSLYGYDGSLVWKESSEDNGLMEIAESPDFRYHCDVYVNMKNIARFVPNEKARKWYYRHPHELYILKAKYIYHKIRNDFDGDWWD